MSNYVSYIPARAVLSYGDIESEFVSERNLRMSSTYYSRTTPDWLKSLIGKMVSGESQPAAESKKKEKNISCYAVKRI